MIRARIKGDNVVKMLRNSVEYSTAFATELKRNQDLLNRKLGEESIDAFYEDEMQRALTQDSQAASLFISPKTFYGDGV